MTLNQIKLFLLMLLCGVVLNCAPKKTELQKMEESTNKILGEFQKELLGTLQTSLQTKGASGAIEICKDASSKMEEQFSKSENAQFRRVSLKNRNPKHFPNEWEKKVIDSWEEKIANKEQVGMFTEETETELRYMKPIFIVNQTCLQCHGDKEIDNPTAEKIRKWYPEDKAIGYKVGDLRGAFSVAKKR